ncbi:hypothetical protein [Nonomuraea cavernae]|uniref:hypothetical protein n=1 Tax=Nonomuraea cavernae TaxID=2045107 RepID=UPI001669A92D|nr:hypothetical protein [Nonomuraea cavernae]MCA2190407.1 hypothetical protein [Nonomuraea cavernae]
MTDVSAGYQRFTTSWAGLGGLVVAGVLLALLTGSRLSPVSSLIGGLMFTGLGIVPILDMRGLIALPEAWIGGQFRSGYLTLGHTGLFLFLGVALLVVSAFPSRWRSTRPPVVTPGHYSPGHDHGPPYQGQHYQDPSYQDQGQSYRDQGSAHRDPGPPYSAPGPSYRQPPPEDVTRPMHRD